MPLFPPWEYAFSDHFCTPSVLAYAGTRAACHACRILKALGGDMGVRRQNGRRLPSTKMAVFADGEACLSTIRAVPVDKWQKNLTPSTDMPEIMDAPARSSTPRAVCVDKWQKNWLPSMYKPEIMDRAARSSTPEPVYMDKNEKKTVLSTKMAVFAGGEACLSTPRAVSMDKRQKNWLLSMYKPEIMDRAARSSTPEPVFMDGSRLKARLIPLKKVDAAYAANIFYCSGSTVPSDSPAVNAIPVTG